MEYKTVFFKNNEIYAKAKKGFFIQAFQNDNGMEVWIDDMAKPAWQLPLSGTKDIGNPKVKQYTLEEFNKHFYIP